MKLAYLVNPLLSEYKSIQDIVEAIHSEVSKEEKISENVLYNEVSKYITNKLENGKIEEGNFHNGKKRYRLKNANRIERSIQEKGEEIVEEVEEEPKELDLPDIIQQYKDSHKRVKSWKLEGSTFRIRTNIPFYRSVDNVNGFREIVKKFKYFEKTYEDIYKVFRSEENKNYLLSICWPRNKITDIFIESDFEKSKEFLKEIMDYLLKN
jgi:hypothetical protein